MYENFQTWSLVTVPSRCMMADIRLSAFHWLAVRRCRKYATLPGMPTLAQCQCTYMRCQTTVQRATCSACNHAQKPTSQLSNLSPASASQPRTGRQTTRNTTPARPVFFVDVVGVPGGLLTGRTDRSFNFEGCTHGGGDALYPLLPLHYFWSIWWLLTRCSHGPPSDAEPCGHRVEHLRNSHN